MVSHIVITPFVEGFAEHYNAGVKIFYKTNLGTEIHMICSRQKVFWQATAFEYKRKPFSILKEISTKENINSTSELIKFSDNLEIENTLPKPYFKHLEQALLKLNFLPQKEYKYICSILALAQSYNYLFIPIGLVCFTYRLALSNTTNSSNLQKIYSSLDISSLTAPSAIRKKKYGRWRLSYIAPASQISNEFINTIYISQLKNKKSLSKYQITSDFQTYRTEFSNLLKYVTVLINFYLLLPIISLIIKILLTHLYWSFLTISTKCSSYICNFIPFSLKNINNFNIIIKIKFFFLIMFAAIANYVVLYLTQKSANKIDSFLLSQCEK